MTKRRIALALLIVAAIAGVLLATRGDEGEATVVASGEACAGFTPTGSRLDDEELIDAAVSEWLNLESAPTPPNSPALGEGDEVCIVHADTDEHGFPHVAMISDERVATFEGLEEEDLEVAHIDFISRLGDDAPVVGVGDGKWLLSDRVRTARLFTGSQHGRPRPTELDPAESRLVDLEGKTGGVLVATTSERTHLATGQGEDAEDQVASVPVEPGDLDHAAFLRAPDAVSLLASAIRFARGEPEYAPGALRLIDAIRVPGVGTVLLSEGVHEPLDPDEQVRPMLTLAAQEAGSGLVGSFGIGPDYVPSGDDGPNEVILALDPRRGWVAGALIAVNQRPRAYVVAARPPLDPAGKARGEVRLDMAVGRTRQSRSGPLAWLPARGANAAAVIGTAPDGNVVRTLPVHDGQPIDTP